ncbi:MAG TPA: TIGR03619 family F420-dependent LLM class oxidoreductase [Chloroflexota bacterium]
MKVGITIGTNWAGVPQPDTFFHFIDRVEDLGLDSLWVGDHIAWTNPTLEALTVLACYVARTKRLTIGTSVLIMPLRQPVVLAKMLGTMAFLSNGRVVAGMGVGGENKKEFEACGVPHHQRGQIMDESLEVMTRLWKEDNVSFHGGHFNFDGVSLDPKPPKVPLWLGGRSEVAHRRAARYGDAWIDVFSSPRHFGEAKKAIEALGVKPGFQWAQFEYMCIAKSREKGKAKATEYLSRTYNMDVGERVNAFASFGTAEQIAERIHQFQELGADHLIINPTCTPQEKHDHLEAIASELLPLIREQ